MKPATKAAFNSPEGVAILEMWKKLYDQGMGNDGRTTVDTRNVFVAQKAAMIIESTATVKGLLDQSAGKFELGTGFLPRPNEDAFKKSGTIIGGASVWIMKDRPAAEQQCVWEYIKFISGAKQQAYWQSMSG